MLHNKNQKKLKDIHKCSKCKKGFIMAWAKSNHEKYCMEGK